MANVIRIKRRGSGAAGAPAALKSAELAHNEVDNTVYIGKGDDGSGNATTIVPVGGAGAFADLSSTQTIGGAKTFATVPKSSQDASGSTDLVRKSQIDTALSAKANTSHSHAISDVTGLQTALDGKAASSHTHSISAITGLQSALDEKLDDSQASAFGLSLLDDADAAAARTTLGLGSAATQASTAFAAASHGHLVSDVTGLQMALDGKAAATHAHGISDVTGLQTALDNKLDDSQATAFGLSLLNDADAAAARTTLGLGTAATSNTTAFAAATHAHAISDVTGLQAALDGKAASSHTHGIGDVTGLQTALDGKAASAHTHGIADVTGLQTALDAKAPLASPALTGTPTAPTAANGTNTTQLATTAFVRATRLDQLAQPTADVPFNARKITGLADPVSAQDAATKAYVDLAVQGLDPKQSVKAASTGNIATLSGTMTIDGVALVAGDRILVKDQSTASQNGVYVVAAGAWSRAADMNTWDEHVSAYLFVEQGAAHTDIGYLCTVDGGGTLGTTAITFVQFSGAGQIIAGAGLTKSGNTVDIATASSARIVVNADSIDLATTGVGAGAYRSVTVDTYGRVTAGSNPTTLAGYGITDAQPLDATLTAFAGLTTVADRLVYATGADAFALTTFTSFARTLLDDVDAAAARTTLGLGTMATQAANTVAITGGTIDGVILDGGTF